MFSIVKNRHCESNPPTHHLIGEISAPSSDNPSLDPDWDENSASKDSSKKVPPGSSSGIDDFGLERNDGMNTATPNVSKSKSTTERKNKSASKRKKPQDDENDDEEVTPPVKKSRGKSRKTMELERRLQIVESELAHHKGQDEDQGANELRRSTRGKKKGNVSTFKGEFEHTIEYERGTKS